MRPVYARLVDPSDFIEEEEERILVHFSIPASARTTCRLLGWGCLVATVLLVVFGFVVGVTHYRRIPWQKSEVYGDNLEPNMQSDGEATYKQGFLCKGNRLSNETPLKAGEALCSKRGDFVFGVRADGDLVWLDPVGSKTRTFVKGSSGDYLVLHQDGRLAVYDELNNIKWQRESTPEIQLSPKCLPPDFDCPYLHLHNGGVVVLNWIDDMKVWHEDRIHNIYDLSRQ